MRNRIKLTALTALVTVIIPTMLWNLWQVVDRKREQRYYN